MSATPTQSDWQAIYQEALLESDPTRVPRLIEQAHKAVLGRSFELRFAGVTETKERHELDAALYFLGLLRDACTRRSEAFARDTTSASSTTRHYVNRESVLGQ